MMEFETFVLLENQKTGSSYLMEFFRRHSRERLVRLQKHATIKGDHDRSKIYLTSVRSPVSLYVSLFNFGLTGRGRAQWRLSKKGHGGLYGRSPQHFERWVEFVLDPANHEVNGRGYGEAVASILGFLSFRFLTHAVADGAEKLRACDGPDAVRALYAKDRLVGHVLRNENLSADLRALVTGPLRHAIREVDAAIAYIDEDRRVNKS